MNRIALLAALVLALTVACNSNPSPTPPSPPPPPPPASPPPSPPTPPPPPPTTGQLQVTVQGIPLGTAMPLRLTGPDAFDSGFFGSNRTFSGLVPGIYTLRAFEFRIGQVKEPGCTFFTADFPTHLLDLAAGQTEAASVTYTSVPCG